MFGYEPAEMLGSTPAAIIHPDDFRKVDPLFRAFGPDSASLQLTFRMRRKDAVYIWVEVQYRYLPDDGGLLAVMRDITARKQAEEMLADANEKLEAANRILQALAHRDGLTGLMNRRRFDELLQEEFDRARRQSLPLALLLFDVDHFKAYNDRYGHLAGDECLRRISRAIEGALQRPGDHVGRYGGEEFVVILPATDQRGCMLVADQLREIVSAMRLEHLGSNLGIVTISVGGSAMVPCHAGDRSTELIEAADRALYQAKMAGRNCTATWPLPGSGPLADLETAAVASAQHH
jgi:diguanylate cyclase (GGDEF)-like protein